MCKNTDDNVEEVYSADSGPSTEFKVGSVLMGVLALGFMISTIVLAVDDNKAEQDLMEFKKNSLTTNVPPNENPDIESIFDKSPNLCTGMNPKFPNVDCVHKPGPQAGANVTKGYVGGMNVTITPQTNHYWQSSMCPVNVHWHLGTEHYSLGQYDENGDGPDGNAEAPMRRLAEDWERPERGLAGETRGGFRCHHYDEKDEKFTKEYEWKHCVGMKVGETYEVHWPHSAAGACGTVNQYQTPFYDGVFCNLPLDAFMTLGPQDIAHAVGVQAQIYTVVNDEEYFYPDLMRSWIVDDRMGMGSDIHYYTGSTTGTSRDNEVCSQYTPITWQVDRQCHMISASSFDKLCYDMKQQRDDMSDDLYAHGSRILVADSLVANNQQRERRELLDGHDHGDEDVHTHLRSHSHDHGHDHHHEWY